MGCEHENGGFAILTCYYLLLSAFGQNWGIYRLAVI